MTPHRYLRFIITFNKCHIVFDMLDVTQLMKCYSNGTGVYVVDMSLSVDQKRQQDNEKDCTSCM